MRPWSPLTHPRWTPRRPGRSPRAAAALAALTLLLVAASAEADCQGPGVVFCDDFESRWTKWNQNPATSSFPETSLAPDNSNYPGAPAGATSAQAIYKAGTTDSGGAGLIKNGVPLPAHALVQFDIKFSPGFHFPQGQKLWRAMPNMGTGQLQNDTMLNLQVDYGGSALSFEVFSGTGSDKAQEFLNRQSISTPATDKWHRIAVRIKANTFNGSTPTADGETELFWDGKSLGTLKRVRMYAVPDKPVRDFWGGPGNYTSVGDPLTADQWIRVDNVSIVDLAAAPKSPSAASSPPDAAGTR